MRKKKKGKLLGGEPPRRGRGGRQRARDRQSLAPLGLFAAGLFVIGVVVGFAWAMDREIRGGILRQHAEARQRPDWVPLGELPSHLPEAFLAVTDPSFLDEGSLRTGEQGTTLARELVRHVHLLPSSLSGEARELVMAPVLEQRTSKRTLLEIYLNRVPMGVEKGARLYGVQHAAREYLGKDARQLTLSEAATLAGLRLSPQIEDPREAIGAVGARRNEVLRVMLLGRLISEEEYRAATREPLGIQPGIRDLPMSRPLDFGREEVIRLPPDLRPRPDSVPTEVRS